MTLLFLAMWLQMSAPNCGQGYSYPPAQGFGCYTDPGIVPRAADETDGKPPYQERIWCTGQTGCVNAKGEQVPAPDGGCAYGIECPAEHVDVPAVQETREVDGGQDCNVCKDGSCTALWCVPHKEKRIFNTCADKSRILEHDENSPPKYWCRKVEF